MEFRGGEGGVDIVAYAGYAPALHARQVVAAAPIVRGSSVVLLLCFWCEPDWRDHLNKNWLTWDTDDSSGFLYDSSDESPSAEYVGPAPEPALTSASSSSVQRAIQDGHRN